MERKSQPPTEMRNLIDFWFHVVVRCESHGGKKWPVVMAPISAGSLLSKHHGRGRGLGGSNVYLMTTSSTNVGTDDTNYDADRDYQERRASFESTL